MKLRKFIACENLREAREKLLKGTGGKLSLFRGDASSNYELVPSALRKNKIERVFGLYGAHMTGQRIWIWQWLLLRTVHLMMGFGRKNQATRIGTIMLGWLFIN